MPEEEEEEEEEEDKKGEESGAGPINRMNEHPKGKELPPPLSMTSSDMPTLASASDTSLSGATGLGSSYSTPTTTTKMTTPTLPGVGGMAAGGGRRSSQHAALQNQGSADSWVWERRRSKRKRPSIHSTGSRRFSSASTRSEGEGGDGMRRDSGAAASRNGLLIASKGASATSFVGSDEEAGRPEWALDQIELSDSDSDLEFFDAKGELSRRCVGGTEERKVERRGREEREGGSKERGGRER